MISSVSPSFLENIKVADPRTLKCPFRSSTALYFHLHHILFLEGTLFRMSLPTQNKMWTVQGNRGFDSLILSNSGTVPKFSLNDVLVKFHAVALNYRDISIPKVFQPHSSSR